MTECSDLAADSWPRVHCLPVLVRMACRGLLQSLFDTVLLCACGDVCVSAALRVRLCQWNLHLAALPLLVVHMLVVGCCCCCCGINWCPSVRSAAVTCEWR